MKSHALMLSASAVALAVCSALLFARARREGERADSERAMRLAREAELRELKQTTGGLERQLAELRRAPPVIPAPAAPVQQPPRQEAEAIGAIGQGPTLDPITAAHIRKHDAVSTYGALAHELGLSNKQADELFAAMAEPNEPEPAPSAGGRLPTRAEQERMSAKREAKALALLGQDKAAQFRAYQQSLPQRLELRYIRQHLELFGTPLRDEQHAGLLKIMTEERERVPPTRFASIDDLRSWQEDEQRRIHERASALLSADQLQRLDEYHRRDAFGGLSFGGGSMVAYGVEEDE